MTEIKKGLISEIIRIVEKHTSLVYDSEKRHFDLELYADYRDSIDDKSISEWCKSENPREAFEDSVFQWYETAIWDAEDSVVKEVCKNWASKIHSYADNEEFIEEWVKESLNIELPYKHYLDQSVCVDIIVDTGDGNYDYVLNDIYPHYNARQDDVIHEEASLLWLARQQGYSKRQLNAAIRKCEFGDSKLLKSIRTEVHNCSSHMNALTFFIEMTVEELLNLQDEIKKNSKNDIKDGGYTVVWNRKGKRKLIISKDAVCGLYDTWNGAGSVLEIELEKDVELPMKYISTAWPDGARGWSVRKTYGICNSMWTRTLQKIA